jgi:hypothetical protein
MTAGHCIDGNNVVTHGPSGQEVTWGTVNAGYSKDVAGTLSQWAYDYAFAALSNWSLDSEWQIETSETTGLSQYHRIDSAYTGTETTSNVVCYSGASQSRTFVYSFSPYRTLCAWYNGRTNDGYNATNMYVCHGDSGAQVYAYNQAYGIVSRNGGADTPYIGPPYPSPNTCTTIMYYVRMQAQLADKSMSMSGYNSTRLQFAHSSYCINAVNSVYTNPTTLAQYSCTTTSGRWWRLIPVNNGNSDEYYVVRRDNNGHCVTLDSPFGNSSAVKQRPCFSGVNQRWMLIRTPGGANEYFSLSSSQSGVCIDVPNSSTSSGVAVIGYGCTANPDQRLRVA